jgi:hypothetical protein
MIECDFHINSSFYMRPNKNYTNHQINPACNNTPQRQAWMHIINHLYYAVAYIVWTVGQACECQFTASEYHGYSKHC